MRSRAGNTERTALLRTSKCCMTNTARAALLMRPRKIQLVEMQALWGEPTSDFTRMRRNRMHVCCGLVAEWLSLASLLCSESMLRRCAKSTFETFELQRSMYVRCKPHVPLLNLNRTHAPSEGDGRTIHDNIYKYTDSAGVDRTRRGSLRLAPIRCNN